MQMQNPGATSRHVAKPDLLVINHFGLNTICATELGMGELGPAWFPQKLSN